MSRLPVGAFLLAAGFVVWLAIRDGGGAAAVAPVRGTAAVDACLAGRKQVAERRRARGGPAPAGQPSDDELVGRACAALFLQAGCREAFLHPGTGGVAGMIQVCARDYCAALPAPRPRACDPGRPPPEDGMETFATWAELQRAIFIADLGAAAAARLEER